MFIKPGMSVKNVEIWGEMSGLLATPSTDALPVYNRIMTSEDLSGEVDGKVMTEEEEEATQKK